MVSQLRAVVPWLMLAGMRGSLVAADLATPAGNIQQFGPVRSGVERHLPHHDASRRGAFQPWARNKLLRPPLARMGDFSGTARLKGAELLAQLMP